LTIEPAAGATSPILDGNQGSATGCPTGACDGPILSVGSGEFVHLSGLTIQDAKGTSNPAGGADGGALFVNGFPAGLTVSVDHCVFENNSAFLEGGAIYEQGPAATSMTVTDSSFFDNSSSAVGGAITAGGIGANDSDTTLKVIGSTFTGNHTGSSGQGSGGAIASGSGNPVGYGAGADQLTVKDSSFTDNSVTAGGGGAISAGDDGGNGGVGDTSLVVDSTFSGNSGYPGGAILNDVDGGHADMTVTGSTFSNNNSAVRTYEGGAIATGSGGSDTVQGAGTLTVTNSTFSGDAGGEIKNLALTGQFGPVTVAGDVFSGACIDGGSWTDDGYNVGSDASCFGSPAAAGDVNAGPSLAGQLGPLQDNGGPTQTIALLPANPAIGNIPLNTTASANSQQVTLCPGTDQRGDPRPDPGDQACDSGAFELQQPPTKLTYTGPTGGQYGTLVTLTAQLTQGGTGLSAEMVKIGFGGESCSGPTGSAGTASCSVTPTDSPAGSPYQITANFAGDQTYQPSKDTSQSFTVNKADTTITLSSSANPSTTAQTVTYSATVARKVAGSGSPTGTVSFSDGGTTISGCGAVTLSAGTATCKVAYQSTAGSPHQIAASYSGDPDFSSSSGTLSQTVGPAPTTLVAAPAKLGLLSVTFSATLTRGEDGSAISGKTIVFSVQGNNECQATTNSSGVASCTLFPALVITLGPSSYTASFAGDATYHASSANGHLTSGLTLLGLMLGTRSGSVHRAAIVDLTLSRRGGIVYASGRGGMRHGVTWIRQGFGKD
jgi:predicted outer membrane repeat protein